MLYTDGTSEPTLFQSDGDDNENNVENAHEYTHGLGHFPLEKYDGEEDKDQHNE